MYRTAWRWSIIPRSCLSTVSEGIPGVLAASRANTEATAMTNNCAALQDTQNRIMSATILVRNPLILHPLSEFELAYEEYRQALQAERSRGTFDIMTAQRRELEELRASGEAVRGSESPSRPEPLISAEANLTPIYKEANLDLTSLMRHLGRKLYFVVKNGRDQWQFPATYVPTADTALHKLAARMMRRLLGEEGNLYPLGAAPVAYHYEELRDRVTPPYGIKTFFFRSQLIAGKLKFHPEVSACSFAWLTREELEGLLPSDYFKSISRVLAH